MPRSAAPHRPTCVDAGSALARSAPARSATTLRSTSNSKAMNPVWLARRLVSRRSRADADTKNAFSQVATHTEHAVAHDQSPITNRQLSTPTGSTSHWRSSCGCSHVKGAQQVADNMAGARVVASLAAQKGAQSGPRRPFVQVHRVVRARASPSGGRSLLRMLLARACRPGGGPFANDRLARVLRIAGC